MKNETAAMLEAWRNYLESLGVRVLKYSRLDGLGFYAIIDDGESLDPDMFDALIKIEKQRMKPDSGWFVRVKRRKFKQLITVK